MRVDQLKQSRATAENEAGGKKRKQQPKGRGKPKGKAKKAKMKEPSGESDENASQGDDEADEEDEEDEEEQKPGKQAVAKAKAKRTPAVMKKPAAKKQASHENQEPDDDGPAESDDEGSISAVAEDEAAASHARPKAKGKAKAKAKTKAAAKGKPKSKPEGKRTEDMAGILFGCCWVGACGASHSGLGRLLQEELEIFIVIAEFNRTSVNGQRLMAYWSRKAFALMESNGSTATLKQLGIRPEFPRLQVRKLHAFAQVGYCGASSAPISENFLPVKKLVPFNNYQRVTLTSSPQHGLA